MLSSTLCLLLGAVSSVAAVSNGGDIRDPIGMSHFVTRPELISPQLMVRKHHPKSITPGYWFITPYYITNQRQRADTKEYIPCQTGAHIYDGDGELIWSGSCKYDNRNIFAFQPVDINGTQHLSFWLGHQFIGDPKDIPEEDVPSSAVLLDNTYNEVRRVFQFPFLDCHEVSFQPDGKSILLTRLWKEKRNLKKYGKTNTEVLHGGFRELSLIDNEPIFDWDPVAANVTLDESCDRSGKGSDVGDAWDYFHINSIDKNKEGDYLISARHTSTIYKISGTDGSVMWRLGGYMSDFEMEEDLPFYWQHHARLLFENSTHAVVSVFDNAGDDFGRNPDIPNRVSVGKIMLLDTVNWKATMLRRFDRPDGMRTPMGGSVFIQGDDPFTSNVLVNWVIPGYFSEYDAENRLVFEARFGSPGIKTYRAFKAPFIGHPTEPIAFKTMAIGYETDSVSTAFFVSWNGATEVVEWSFHGSEQVDGVYVPLKTVKKRGFETSWVMPGVVRYAYVVALDKYGKELGRSAEFCIEPVPQTIAHNGEYQVRVPVLEGLKSEQGDEALTFSVTDKSDAVEEVPALDIDAYVGDVTADTPETHFPPQSADSLAKHAMEKLTVGSVPPTVCTPKTSALIEKPTSAYSVSTLIVDAFAILGLWNLVRAILMRRKNRGTEYQHGIFLGSDK